MNTERDGSCKYCLHLRKAFLRYSLALDLLRGLRQVIVAHSAGVFWFLAVRTQLGVLLKQDLFWAPVRDRDLPLGEDVIEAGLQVSSVIISGHASKFPS